jgi:hypothetical protein
MSYECLDTRKCCHAKLYEKADPLKALGSVASFLGNRIFTLINDKICQACKMMSGDLMSHLSDPPDSASA